MHTTLSPIQFYVNRASASKIDLKHPVPNMTTTSPSSMSIDRWTFGTAFRIIEY